MRTAAARANGAGEGREPSLCVGPRWELAATRRLLPFSFPTGSFLRTRFPRLTLKQPSRERSTNSPSTDERERVDTLESEQTLWEKGGKKEKKRRRQLPWKLPSCHPLLRNGVADEANSQGLRALFNPLMPEEPPQPPEYSEQG